MFRITSHTAGDEHVLKLEGCLQGAWVHELDTCWREAMRTQHGRPIRVDLTDVCHVDDGGFELMTTMYRAGARFVTKGCFMREAVREISEAVEADPAADAGLPAEARSAKAGRS
jgi:ABC-type transporter Mla MlaB component